MRNKNALSRLVSAVCFLGSLGAAPIVTTSIAYAKPPDWAPAHGYRRKHEGHDDDKDERFKDREENRTNREDWKRKLEDQLEDRFPGYKIFTTLDQDRSGSISRQEWNEGDDLFSKLDTNSNGQLSRSEYSHVEEERGFLGNMLAKVKEKVTGFLASLF